MKQYKNNNHNGIKASFRRLLNRTKAMDENSKLGFFLFYSLFVLIIVSSLFYFIYEESFVSSELKIIVLSIYIPFVISFILLLFSYLIRNRYYNKLKKCKQRIHLSSGKALDKLDIKFPAISLNTVIIKNFHGIINLQLNLNPESKWIFLTGDNAIGKTAILRAILLGIIGKKQDRILANDSSFFEINLYTYEGRLQLPSTKSKFSNYVCGYGPSRLTPLGISNSEIAEKSSVYYSLFRDDGLLQNILLELPLWEAINHNKYLKTKELLIKILPNISDLKVKEKEVLFYENDSSQEGKLISELSSGNKMLINMVGDIILRLSKEQKNVESYEDLEGIVLIDEFDIHLHPVRLKELPNQLSSIFPKIQFIASTHSPIPLLGVNQNTEILKVFKDEKYGILADIVKIDNIEAVSPNILFTSPIFDMKEIFSNQISSLKDFRTEDRWSEMKQNKELEQELLMYYKKNIHRNEKS